MATAARSPANGHALRDVVGGDRNKSGSLIHAIPSERFGTDRGRLLRKLVLIAKSSDRDGTNAWPSMETIARRCLVSIEAVRKAINWLVTHGLLAVESKAAPITTSKFGRPNRYTILFPEPEHIQMEVVDAGDAAYTTMQQASTTTELAYTNRKPTMTVPLTSPLTGYAEPDPTASRVQGLDTPDTPISNSKPHSADRDGKSKTEDQEVCRARR
jgi:hypothetical protein